MESSSALYQEAIKARVGNRPFYLLLDASYIKDLAATIYSEESEPQLEVLYQGTSFEEMMDVSPFLLMQRIDSPFFNWMIENLPPELWGSVIISGASLHDVANHLRSLLLVKTSQENAVYFRCYAPHILQALLDGASEESFAQLMGVMQHVMLSVQHVYPRALESLVVCNDSRVTLEGFRIYQNNVRHTAERQAPWYQLSKGQQALIGHAKSLHRLTRNKHADMSQLAKYIAQSTQTLLDSNSIIYSGDRSKRSAIASLKSKDSQGAKQRLTPSISGKVA